MSQTLNTIPEFSFSLSEIFSLIGLVQAVAVIVYILFRAGHIRHVVVPVLCFFVLGTVFLLDFGYSRLAHEFPLYPYLQNSLWLAIPAFSVLLIIQVADLGVFPKVGYWATLLLPLAASLLGWAVGAGVLDDPSCHVLQYCGMDERMQAGTVLGIMSGLLCFLVLWVARGSFEPLSEDKETKSERFWLIISFIVINLSFIFVALLSVSDSVSGQAYFLLRDVLGVGMSYIASTSLFRIYPPSVKLEKKETEDTPNEEDLKLIKKLNQLLDFDKVYHELNFSRADLARELDISEARVSRLVSIAFDKSLPQVINERRIKDSLLLLEQTDAQISVVAEQVGFNSVPTFNRVFKENMGISPSEYRTVNKN